MICWASSSPPPEPKTLGGACVGREAQGGSGYRHVRSWALVGVAQSLDIIRAEIARLAENSVSAEELSAAKQYLTGAFPLRLDTGSKVAGILAQMQFDALGIDYLERRNSYMEAVTLDDIGRVVRRLLDPERMRIVVVGDPEDLAPDGA